MIIAKLVRQTKNVDPESEAGPYLYADEAICRFEALPRVGDRICISSSDWRTVEEVIHYPETLYNDLYFELRGRNAGDPAVTLMVGL
jgi:hypothetical protein